VGSPGDVPPGEAMLAEVKKLFNPEFLNRLTGTVVFGEMTLDMARRILDKQLGVLQSLLTPRGVQLLLTDCTNKAVFTSQIGKSREKEFKKSYQEALRNALSGAELATFKAAYQVPSVASKPSATTAVPELTSTAAPISEPLILFLYAKPTNTGYELFDKKTNQLEFKLRKLNTPDVFLAFDVEEQKYGVLEKDGSTFYKFTFYKQIDGAPITFSAQINFN